MASDDSKALAQFMRNALNNEDIVLKSEGTQLYSYSHVSDVVEAMLYIMNYGRCGEAYNIADEKSNIRLRDLASILASYNGKEVVFELPDEVERRGYSTATKAIMSSQKLNDLGWLPYYNIQDGLTESLDIMKEMRERPLTLKKKID
jgi:nucleoside-diphosphate-sugar epimerase